MKHQLQRRRVLSETLESRLLLTGAAGSAIEKFNLSPAVFVENAGQWTDSSVRFVHQARGASIAMTDRGPVFELYRDRDATSAASTRFSVSFRNSNATTPVGSDRASSTFSYHLGESSQHRSNVSGFEKIIYPSLYKGIDLHTWGQRDSLKYEFHVEPNVDYRQIAVQYEGVQDLWIDDRGRLHAELSSGFGKVIDDAPVIYQDVNGKRVDVAGRFKLLDGNAYTFELTGRFDATLPLVIDPDLLWTSYLGGGNEDSGTSITVDSNGNAYVTGNTGSSSWASGGFDTSYAGGQDVFVAKVNANGTLAWSSYLGGSNTDRANGISLDANGNVWVAGQTKSGGWTVDGFDTSYNGGYDAFVAMINVNGTLAWSSYLGGSGDDYGNGVSLDSNGNARLAGTTIGFDANEGDQDAFVAKIDSDGTLDWRTYIGGNDTEIGAGVAVDSSGNAFVTGETHTSGWATGGFDTSYNGGDSDVFVAKVSASGALTWSSYLGGSSDDSGSAVAIDINGNIWITGSTWSSGWVTSGFDTTYNGDRDGFVSLIWANETLAGGTYFGGSGSDFARSISTDLGGNAWVTGETNSAGWALGGFDTSYNGNTDAIVLKVLGNGLLGSASYLGASGDDQGYGISFDPTGNVWMTGKTSNSSLADGGFDTTYNGGTSDALVAKISVFEDTVAPVIVEGSDGSDTVSITRMGGLFLTTLNGVVYDRPIDITSSIIINTLGGNDTITIGDDVMGVTVDAGDGNDRIITTDNADLIRAGAGNDYVVANEGDDTVYGAGGKDTLTGAAGRDRLHGENDVDRVNGGKGNDTIFGGSGDDRMYGNEGSDSIDGGGGVDRAWGGIGNDTLIGGGSNDKLYGEDGNDRLIGNAGADIIHGSTGTDAAKDEDDDNSYTSIESFF